MVLGFGEGQMVIRRRENHKRMQTLLKNKKRAMVKTREAESYLGQLFYKHQGKSSIDILGYKNS